MNIKKHHWSGWPGAFCLDCGIEDPFEIALADGSIEFNEDGETIFPKNLLTHDGVCLGSNPRCGQCNVSSEV